VTYEEALAECERRNTEEKFLEHLPHETRPGLWSYGSRLRADWRQRTSSDRVNRPVRAGERFVVAQDIEVLVGTHWSAPFSGGHRSVLPAGTIVVATYDQSADAPGFDCVPADYEALESHLAPAKDRQAAKYDGYSLSFTIDDIGPKLESLA